VTGWTIHDNKERNTWTFPEGITIQQESFLVIVRDAEEFEELFGCSGYVDTGKKNSILNNGGDYIILKDSEGNEIDFVAWGGGDGLYTDWTISAERDKTIQRNNLDTDTDSPDDWLSNQESDPQC